MSVTLRIIVDHTLFSLDTWDLARACAPDAHACVCVWCFCAFSFPWPLKQARSRNHGLLLRLAIKAASRPLIEPFSMSLSHPLCLTGKTSKYI
jgi:hypothetical protein